MATKRTLFEVVTVTRNCEIGRQGERAVVVSLEGFRMTLVFPNRSALCREVRTGSDYRYLKATDEASTP